MEITIKTRDNLLITINTDKCEYPRHYEKAFKLALEIEGQDKGTIDEVFGIMPQMCVGNSINED